MYIYINHVKMDTRKQVGGGGEREREREHELEKFNTQGQ